MSGDLLYLSTADGKQLFVPSAHVRFRAYGGFGAPPTSFITSRGYRQHGSTEIGYLLTPRTITIQLWHEAGCTRQEYWNNRLALHEFLRPNRGGPLLFVLRQPNGNQRALTVRAEPGLELQTPNPEDDSWQIDEPVTLTAFDPVWFDPDTVISAALAQSALSLVFPITFPIAFGLTVESRVAIVYSGTWMAYPKLIVTGPYTTAILENVDTGARIYLSNPVAGGEFRVIVLTPGSQSITDSLGGNRFSDLSTASNLVDFNIRPNPELPGGVQTIRAVFSGGIANMSGLRLEYNNRYFAI